ncbi:MAG TPA: PQQ-dependent sugar dehydrogenase [Solirubrobacterales bacterium]|nr:PQQ-dependent sugar dehydrogenase [Solirubrobacterales bacterium]
MIRAAATLGVLVSLLATSAAQALTLEPVGEFDQPVYVTSDPGDADRLFVAERSGIIRLLEDEVSSVFADLTTEVECCENERGLASIALDPDFDDNGRLYAFYTGTEEPGELHVDELLSTDPNHQNAAFEANLLIVPHGDFLSHNGGQLQFGPDGDLYVSTGDGGGNNDPLDNAQDPASPLGKVLRIDPDDPNLPNSYEIWSSGLRNPFRFSFDSLSGDMVIGDVGQTDREEIDFAPSPFPGIVGGEGANYGWDCREGLMPGAGPSPLCAALTTEAFTEPVFDYPHTPDPDLGGTDRCSVIGGYVARDPGLGALLGRYVYADLCSGVVRSLQLPAAGSASASGDCSLGLRLQSPVSFGEDAAHRLYVVEQGGAVYRLAGSPPADCPALPVNLPPAPESKPQPGPTFVGITAQRRRVERGKAALLTVWVSPCQKRKGQSVALFRNGARNGSRFLSRACTARFLRRVHRNTVFAAVVHASSDYLAGSSRGLKIKIRPRRPAPRPR